MKEVFRNADSALVGLYQSVLEGAGIPTLVSDTDSQQLPVAGLATAIFPLPQFFPKLYVINDDDYEEAMAILRGNREAAPGAPDWQCSQCGESVPDNFSVCWSCDRARE